MDTLPFSTVSNINLAQTMGSDDVPTPKAGSSKAVSGVRVPGSYAKRRVSANVVPYGQASFEVCESVFRASMAEYGLSGSTEEKRDEYLWCLAEALVYGTSTEINYGDVWFEIEGSRHSMAAFAGIVGRFIGHTNPVRVFVRCFRKGELPMRIFELLNNPANTELRQVMAANYGTTVENAKFCFDTAVALIASGMSLSHSDIFLINSLSFYTISRAQGDSQSRGEAQASSNHAGTIGGVRPGAGVSPAIGPAAPPEARGGFKTLRG